jgi:hypothetical protein
MPEYPPAVRSVAEALGGPEYPDGSLIILSTAVHESAHAVIGEICGLHIESVHLNGFNGHVINRGWSKASTRKYSKRNKRRARKFLVVAQALMLAAGVVAQMAFVGNVKVALSGCALDMLMLKHLLRKLTYRQITRLVEQTHRLVLKHGLKINAVASALMDHPRQKLSKVSKVMYLCIL